MVGNFFKAMFRKEYNSRAIFENKSILHYIKICLILLAFSYTTDFLKCIVTVRMTCAHKSVDDNDKKLCCVGVGKFRTYFDYTA